MHAPRHEAITVSSTAVGISALVVGGRSRDNPESRYAFLTLETANIRWRADGIDPTDSTGHIMASGTSLELFGYDTIRRFRAIRDTASDGILTVTCWDSVPQ